MKTEVKKKIIEKVRSISMTIERLVAYSGKAASPSEKSVSSEKMSNERIPVEYHNKKRRRSSHMCHHIRKHA